MSIPLPSSGANVQRWGLVKLVQYPAIDRLGVARDNSLLLNVRICILSEWIEVIRSDNGAFAWGEICNGWGLYLVESSNATLTAITNDLRATIRVFPQKLLTDTLTAGQITTLNGWLLNIGLVQTEINNFNLSGKSIAQIFNWLNRGICALSFSGSSVIEDTITQRQSCITIESIVNAFNFMKTHA
jgi:hypothetical protein